MDQYTIKRHEVDDILNYAEELGASLGEGADFDNVVVETYSGRGMYGDACFGLRLNSEVDFAFVAMGAARFQAELDEAADQDGREWRAETLIRNTRVDSLGRSTLYYFPGFRVV